jgi:hypothetical protein
MKQYSIDPARLAAVQAASQFAQGANTKLQDEANAAARRRHDCIGNLAALRSRRSSLRMSDRAEIDGEIEAAEHALEAAEREVERTRREAEVQSEVRNEAMRTADACRVRAEKNS